MKVEDVQRCVEKALVIAGLQNGQRPKLLSDNGSCYIASELKEYLLTKGVKPIHGRANHPQTQGKIERYHRTMKNIVKLNHYYCPDELIDAVEDFVNYYNHKRYHESLDNVTPADVYFGKKEQILRRRERIKTQNMTMRRALYATEKLNNI
jgi:putative transposase